MSTHRSSSLKALFAHQRPPLRPRVLLGQDKACRLIEMTGGIQAAKCPELDGGQAGLIAMQHGLFQQVTSDAFPTRVVPQDEPTQVGDARPEVLRINGQ